MFHDKRATKGMIWESITSFLGFWVLSNKIVFLGSSLMKKEK